jgi:hypothetical protein
MKTLALCLAAVEIMPHKTITKVNYLRETIKRTLLIKSQQEANFNFYRV